MTSTPVEHGALVDWMGPWASMIPELTNPTLHLGTSLVLEEAARTDPRASHFYPNGLHTAPKKIIEVFDGTHTTMPFSSFFCTQPVSPIAECSNFSAGVSCEAGSPPARHLQGKSSAPRNQDHPHRSERPCLVEEMAIVLKWNCGTKISPDGGDHDHDHDHDDEDDNDDGDGDGDGDGGDDDDYYYIYSIIIIIIIIIAMSFILRIIYILYQNHTNLYQPNYSSLFMSGIINPAKHDL